MTTSEEIAKQLVGAVLHTLAGNGPSSVRLYGPHGLEDGAVVFVMPGALGEIIDDALDALYARIGWKVQKRGHGETK